jgi:hypothetical protein
MPEKVSIWEMVESAKINFENFAKMNPHLPIKEHPMWIIAMDQLNTAIEELEKEL